jgi:hypothetical protein
MNCKSISPHLVKLNVGRVTYPEQVWQTTPYHSAFAPPQLAVTLDQNPAQSPVILHVRGEVTYEQFGIFRDIHKGLLCGSTLSRQLGLEE